MGPFQFVEVLAVFLACVLFHFHAKIKLSQAFKMTLYMQSISANSAKPGHSAITYAWTLSGRVTPHWPSTSSAAPASVYKSKYEDKLIILMGHKLMGIGII